MISVRDNVEKTIGNSVRASLSLSAVRQDVDLHVQIHRNHLESSRLMCSGDREATDIKGGRSERLERLQSFGTKSYLIPVNCEDNKKRESQNTTQNIY